MCETQDKVPGLFYNRLWEIAPETKPLFKSTTIAQQGPKLTKMLLMIVDGLDDLDKLTKDLKGLGARHAKYKVTEGAY